MHAWVQGSKTDEGHIDQIKDVIQDFYQMMVQVSAYDLAQGRSSRDVLENSVYVLLTSVAQIYLLIKAKSKHLEQALQTLSTTSQAQPLPGVPAELIQYVDNGRNPDIYTREFVELARRGNQLMKGKMDAFASFRDVLAGEMVSALPELREDIASVVESTGGKRETVVKTESES